MLLLPDAQLSSSASYYISIKRNANLVSAMFYTYLHFMCLESFASRLHAFKGSECGMKYKITRCQGLIKISILKVLFMKDSINVLLLVTISSTQSLYEIVFILLHNNNTSGKRLNGQTMILRSLETHFLFILSASCVKKILWQGVLVFT